ncbi:hypothetical protein VNO77_22647 [Canavalia gladiata]|uniref:Uncharacterized protein n=1 Tax=Canavalia gladiata TaxID=3824 RepID=A0AAN9L5L2_CANGL
MNRCGLRLILDSVNYGDSNIDTHERSRNFSIIYLKLDVDGNLRWYSWVKLVWQSVKNQCKVLAKNVIKLASMPSKTQFPIEFAAWKWMATQENMGDAYAVVSPIFCTRLVEQSTSTLIQAHAAKGPGGCSSPPLFNIHPSASQMPKLSLDTQTASASPKHQNTPKQFNNTHAVPKIGEYQNTPK